MFVQFREGARPRAPGKRAESLDVFSLLDRRTLAAPGTTDRGDAIPPLRWLRVCHQNEAPHEWHPTFAGLLSTSSP